MGFCPAAWERKLMMMMVMIKDYTKLYNLSMELELEMTL